MTSPTGITLVVAAVALATLAYIAYKHYVPHEQDGAEPEQAAPVNTPRLEGPFGNVHIPSRTPASAVIPTLENLPLDTLLREIAELRLVNRLPQMVQNPSLDEASSGLDELSDGELYPVELIQLDNTPLGTASSVETQPGLDALSDDEMTRAEPVPDVAEQMRCLLREGESPTVHTFGNRTVEVHPPLAPRPQDEVVIPGVTVADPLTGSQISFEPDAPEIGTAAQAEEIEINEKFARLKLAPADPKKKSWQAAQAVIAGIVTTISTACNYVYNFNRELPAFNPERPNLVAAIHILRSGAFLGASVVEEVATELESKYPHLKVAVEGAKTESRLTLPDLEEGKTLYAIPLVLEGQINHMVTFVIDTERNQIEYFDPKGRTILDNEGMCLDKEDRPELFGVYFDILKKYGNPATRVFENTLPHQRDVNNCGAFVLRYITNRARRMSATALQKEDAREGIWTFREELDRMLCSVAPATLPKCDGSADCDFPDESDSKPSSRPALTLGYTSTPVDLEALQDALSELE